MDPRFLLSVFAMLRGKGIILVLIVAVIGYFAFARYGNEIVQKYPALTIVKENIEKVKLMLS